MAELSTHLASVTINSPLLGIDQQLVVGADMSVALDGEKVPVRTPDQALVLAALMRNKDTVLEGGELSAAIYDEYDTARELGAPALQLVESRLGTHRKRRLLMPSVLLPHLQQLVHHSKAVSSHVYGLQREPVAAAFFSNPHKGLEIINHHSSPRAEEHTQRFLAQAGRLEILG